MRKLFTSESVTEGHPDKLCDQIANAILRKKSDARIACEVFAITGVVFIMGEISNGSLDGIGVGAKRWDDFLSWPGRKSAGVSRV